MMAERKGGDPVEGERDLQRLAAACLDGNRIACDEFGNRVMKLVWKCVIEEMKGQPHAVMEDVVSAVLVAVASRMKDIADGTIRAAAPWILTVAQRAAFRFWREAEEKGLLSFGLVRTEEEREMDPPDPNDQMKHVELTERLILLTEHLTDPERTVVDLLAACESVDEIAERFGIDRSTVYRWIKKIRTKAATLFPEYADPARKEEGDE